MTARSFTPILQCLCRHGLIVDGAGLTDGQLLERFSRRGDETAFAALVNRHGPMVLGVCRRVLRNVHEAEDASQATFLLLVRKASSLRQPDLLGPWLHGVAHRTALKAKALAARRHERERPLEHWPAINPPDDLVWRDLRPVLDEAIQRLPSRYRVPFVLCYLEGLTNAQAARKLGCPPGTIATRLARRRKQLRTRLARQGVTLSSGAILTALAGRTASANMAPGLLGVTARFTSAFVAGQGAAAVVPAPVLTLMKGVWTSMLMDKIKVLVVALVMVSVAGIGAGVATFPVLGGEPPIAAEPPKPVRTTAGDEPATAVEPPKPVRTTPVPMPSLARSRTPNFQVDAPTRRMAQLIAEAAERHRKELALRWLGKEIPPWQQPCLIQVEITADRGTGGATSFSFDMGKVTSQHMVLKGSLETLLASALPHEVTHTVWANIFGGPVPRWADEGAALLSEDDESQKRHASVAQEVLADHDRKIPLRRLMEMRRFPDDPTVLYAEGYSITRLLVERKDHRTFMAFVERATRDGWDHAVRTRYDFRDVEALEAAWLDRVRQKGPKTDQPDQPGEPHGNRILPPASGPAPVTAWATMEKEGRIVIHSPVTYYEPKTDSVRRDPDQPPTVVTTYEQVATYTMREYDAREVVAFGTDGKRIEAKALRERLRNPLPVLVSQDGRQVSSFYLQVIKEGTLILVPPAQKPSPPPPIAPFTGARRSTLEIPPVPPDNR